jgi:CHAT domain-containing protein/tetratricopeptide (TPR) repeat protein
MFETSVCVVTSLRQKSVGIHCAAVVAERILFFGHVDCARIYRKRSSCYLFLLAMMLAVVSPTRAQSDEFQELLAKLKEVGRTAEAIPLAERLVVVVRTRFGPNHVENASALGLLSTLYHAGGRLEEAERVMRQAHAITVGAFGPSDPRVAEELLWLAVLVQGQHRLEEAEALSDQALHIQENALGPTDPTLVKTLEFGGLLANRQGKFAKGKLLIARAVSIMEQRGGAGDPNLGRLLRHQALAEMFLGDFDSAEALLRRAVAVLETDPSHSDDLCDALKDLAAVARAKSNYYDSRRLLIRAISLLEKTKGGNHPDLAPPLTLLAQVYQALDQDDLAEPLILRAVDLLAHAPDHYQLLYAEALYRLAAHYSRSDRHEDARQALLKALAITEARVGSEHVDVALILQGLARAENNLGRSGEALSLLKRALAIREKAQSTKNPDYVLVLEELGELHEKLGRHKEADDYLEKALRTAISNEGAGTAQLGSLHLALGTTKMSLGNPAAALAHWKAAFEGQSPFSIFEPENDRASGIQRAAAGLFVVTAFHLAKMDPSVDERFAEEAFVAAQQHDGSRASSALSKMAARASTRNPRLARLVRRAQDLAVVLGRGERSVATRLGGTLSGAPTLEESPEKFDFTQVRSELEGLAQTISVDFPEYNARATRRPTTVAEIRELLRPDEVALVLNTYGLSVIAWALTKEVTRWYRVSDKETADRLIRDLRCGLDKTAWYGDGAIGCAEDLGISLKEAPQKADSLPFDLARAHELYTALFGPIEDMISDKRLLIVPSGLFTQLPFQVLVTEKPNSDLMGTDAYRRAAWLSKRHAITVLPAVSSLKALRRNANASRATKPYIGFGNPLLDGLDYRDGVRAELARAKQQCPQGQVQLMTGVFAQGLKPLRQRGGLADVAEIRTLVPLPETADELCAVARAVGVPESEIWLGVRASEREIKRLSEDGELAAYRIVHFATHGALAGELKAGSEPGLIFSPPGEPSPEDDGYLSASEVAGLKLDADLVVLSACNTAASGVEGAKALSGLARAFFFAGTRALLVSHWAVDSDATVKLITNTLSTMAVDKSIGSAEALRRSMVALIEKGDPHEAHPAIWAPFIVVGEGSPEPSTLTTSSTVAGPPTKQVTKAKPRPVKNAAPADWRMEVWRR